MTSSLKGFALASACALVFTTVLGARCASAASEALAANNQDAAAPAAAPAPAPKPKAKAGGAAAKPGQKPAQMKPHPGAPGNAQAPLPYPGGMIERHAKRLGLDDAAVRKMRSIVEASRAENDKLRKQTEGEQAALRKMLEQDVPDEKAVMAQADKIGDLTTQQRKNQLRAVLMIRNMLTPEQRAELEKIRKEAPGGGPAKK